MICADLHEYAPLRRSKGGVHGDRSDRDGDCPPDRMFLTAMWVLEWVLGAYPYKQAKAPQASKCL